METDIQCIPCTIHQCINTLNVCRVSDTVKKKTIKALLKRLKDVDFSLPPAHNSDLAYMVCKEITNIADPYYKLKRKYNSLALKIYPNLKKLVGNSPDPLYAAAKVSVEGNIIDLGININRGKELDFKQILTDIGKMPLAINDFDKFKIDLANASSILYIGDNAGEIVFDRVFLKELIKEHKNIVFSVKSGPIINDATREDAEEAGINNLVKVIETGSDRSGVNFGHASNEFLKEFAKADLVISKGQANFESLDTVDKNTYFILKAKCEQIARRLNVNYLDLVLVKRRKGWGNKKINIQGPAASVHQGQNNALFHGE